MADLFVIVLSLAAGGATYMATMRAGRRMPAAVGFDAPSGGMAAVALGSEAAEPAPDDADVRETTAEIVELDAVREPAPPEPGDPEPSAVTPRGDGDATAEDAGLPLPPVIVTAGTVPAPEPGYAYLRVSTGRPSWRDRIAGVIGIAILLVLGSAAIAFGIYQLGSGINALLQRFLNG